MYQYHPQDSEKCARDFLLFCYCYLSTTTKADIRILLILMYPEYYQTQNPPHQNIIDVCNKAFICHSSIVTTPTQPQLNSKVGCDMKMTLIHHHPPPPPTTTHHKNSMSAISQLLLNQV